jgi:hypothetical protein
MPLTIQAARMSVYSDTRRHPRQRARCHHSVYCKMSVNYQYEQATSPTSHAAVLTARLGVLTRLRGWSVKLSATQRCHSTPFHLLFNLVHSLVLLHSEECPSFGRMYHYNLPVALHSFMSPLITSFALTTAATGGDNPSERR